MVMSEAEGQFIKAMLKIQPTMMNPFVGKGKKRKTLCKAVDGLSEEAFNMHIPQIIEIINKKQNICEEYADTNAQVDGILEWLPRMGEYRDMLALVIKECRQKYNLKV